jgi:hypothetical protein
MNETIKNIFVNYTTVVRLYTIILKETLNKIGVRQHKLDYFGF